jgi:hypothetical protein
MLMLAPLVLLTLVAVGCGGGGGTADPKQIADAVLEDFKSENFKGIYAYQAPHELEIREQDRTRRGWRMKEKWDLWKNLKKDLSDGDGSLDPKDKSGIANSEEKWTGASDAERYAVLEGYYRIYAADEWEKRLKESDWYWVGRKVNLQEEGEGSATFSYRNNYRDRLEVSLYREGGLWYLGGVELNFEKAMPEKPKDE